MKKITIKKNDLKNTIAIAILFFCSVNLNAQAPVITTNAEGGNDYTFNVSAPGNLKLALEALKTGFSFTSAQKDNFIVNGTLNSDDTDYFASNIGGWTANSWNLNKLDLSGATVAALHNEQFDGTKIYSIKEIILPNALTTLPYKTFAGCTSVTRGAGVTSIGENCYSWSRWTTLGNFDAKSLYPALTTLQNNAFAYNDAGADFTGITLPATFTTFGNSVFSACPKLESVTLYATTPPSLGSFGNRDEQQWNGTEYVTVPAAAITLYVPEASVDAYKAIAGYADYFGVDKIKKIVEVHTIVDKTNSDIFQLTSNNGKIVVVNSQSPLFIQVYSLSGSQVASETISTISTFTLKKGCYLVKVGEKTLKVAI